MQIVAIHLDKEVYHKAKEFAYKRDQPVKSWIAHCVDRAVMNWKDPVTRKRAKSSTEGWLCDMCKKPASECEDEKYHKHLKMWFKR